jgi:putative phosphoribosyl transferase
VGRTVEGGGERTKIIFSNRAEAGKVLAEAIRRDLPETSSSPSDDRPLVLAIPRGGVVVGREVAKIIGADLDVIVPRKLGAPAEPEFAIGAVMHDGLLYINEEGVHMTRTDDRYLESERLRQMQEAKRRLQAYKGQGWEEPRIAGRIVIVVDDGVATGATMIVALRWVRSRGARFVVAATPLAPPSTLAVLRREADRVVCPRSPEPFHAIGSFYREFEQTTDEQVMKILEAP